MTLALLVSISLVLFSFSIKTTTLTQAHCLPDQCHALIQLKQGFNTTELHSWNTTTDCCIWDGIRCDKKTGMVTALDLSDRYISGVLNPALFNLSSLRYLNLSGTYFDNITLPQTGFERLTNLTHLDLSYSGFAGQVPIGISALTNLISLDLSTGYLYLYDNGLKTLLSNLTKLQDLLLDGVDISLNGSEWGNAVVQVGPTLSVLSMHNCGLRGYFPNEISQLTNLTMLNLSSNEMLSGQLPEFTKQSLLQYLYLENTNFTGPLLDSIGNLQYLLKLNLSNSSCYGEIPPSITNLTSLTYWNLRSNRLTGTIPISLFSHPSLKYLNLAYNQLSGYLADHFSNGSSILETIYLQDNNLQGQLSISRFIKHHKYLIYLDLSNNKLSIIEGEKHNESFYASFPQLKRLCLASSNLTTFPSFLSYLKNMYTLDLSNNSLTGEIPPSICVTLPLMLDLSHNNLTGTIPPCLLEDATLFELNLRSNKLSGPLPRNISQLCVLEVINLNGNIINGSLPNSLRYCTHLEILDLGNNQIMDRFPYWLVNLKDLRVLILKSNMFYGKISDVAIKTKGNDSFFPELKVLDLSSNHFSGVLPKTIFGNLKSMMGASDTSNPKIIMDMYVWYIPYVASITYKGLNFDPIKSLAIFTYIDLSNNEFWGRIPEEFGQLKSLDVLNLSHNVLIGSIPQNFANLQQLQLLDLSSNQLSGHIPQELTSLTFLSALNLSYNNLVGEIPKTCQFSTFSNDSYLGNPKLCGNPLTMQCAAARSNHGIYKGLPSKSSTDTIGLSISIGLGLGVGFASVIWATVSWETGMKWFNFIIDGFYFRYFH